ncbi:MAG: aldolase/citrate lyase family protein [Lysobacteraceae bacterium]|jgi:2-dehydro-3-deoxyglucarate aldolase/4-hydroxy-2-oxoheptanedioate aldolase
MGALKEKLKAGQKLSGIHIALSDPAITEMVSNLNYDFIWIDTEHSSIDYGVLQAHLIAARAGNTAAIVRVPTNDPTLVKRILEQGPQGIVFPMINTLEEANQAMNSCLYPPLGHRGLGPMRAIQWNFDQLDEYIETGHKELCRFIQIESKTAVDNLEDILKNKYIDGLIIGACDLSGSIHELNNVFCEQNLSLIDRAITIAKSHNLPIGISTGATDFETIKFWNDRGLSILSCGMEYDYILRGAMQTLGYIKQIQKDF